MTEPPKSPAAASHDMEAEIDAKAKHQVNDHVPEDSSEAEDGDGSPATQTI